MGDPLKVVIAESGTDDPGMFRFVLEGEGFDILAETNSVSDLVSAMAVHQPDVVVMAEQTGLGAIAYVRAVSDAKIVLVSNHGAHAGAADAQVEAASVLTELGPAIQELCGGPRPGVTGSFERPAWIDRVRKDPKTLREILAKGGRSVAASRPSVMELQRRSSGRRLHPAEQPSEHTAAQTGSSTVVDVKEPAIADVVLLPTAALPAGTRIVIEEPERAQRPVVPTPLPNGKAERPPEEALPLRHPHKA
jgi:hypothetical protein